MSQTAKPNAFDIARNNRAAPTLSVEWGVSEIQSLIPRLRDGEARKVLEAVRRDSDLTRELDELVEAALRKAATTLFPEKAEK